MTLNTGTSNESLIKILNGGFKKPSEIFKEHKNKNPHSTVQYSGQMFGDAVYFANPNKISKNTAYVDRVNPGNKFIIVADVYYNNFEKIDGTYSDKCKYDGHNIVCAKNVGRYNRDEYMASPEQIKIKYVLEITPGRLQKPELTKSDKINLNLSDLSTSQANTI